MSTPAIKGWCPGAHRPMMSGDGLVLRVRPFAGELSAEQVLGLCALAETYGNGMLDLTSRANLQIRGVSQSEFTEVLTGLDSLNLIDVDPAVEGHRNVLMPATWARGDLTHRLHNALLKTLPQLPVLPEKMGFAIDTAGEACLTDGSADFRFECDEHGALLLRADGADLGRRVTEADAMDALIELAAWFHRTGGIGNGRMARHLPHVPLPKQWAVARPRAQIAETVPGKTGFGLVLGAPFGKMRTSDLRTLMDSSGASALRLMLGRMFMVKDAQIDHAPGFVTQLSRLMQVHACPGTPFCPQATVSTIQLAQSLAARTQGSVHVSGCAKGCAFPRSAKLTLVGRDGQFDLVSGGRPWDAPSQCGLAPSELSDLKDLI